ncbi:unnamed protein product [Danaus chrysippus]|uniref:(African queen) hypothetical protein n=1 Tax=Danaus chrysippus TaxID=151541 RepID=A0A8J2R0V7_9NEOP|nr:unnamed protein product [Danaus chrysippus]
MPNVFADNKQLFVDTLPIEYLRTYKKENIESTRICFKRRVKKSCDPESKKYLVRHLRLKREPLFTTTMNGRPVLQIGCYRYYRNNRSHGRKATWFCYKNARILTTKRGKPLLQIQGFRFNCKHKTGPKTYWSCNKAPLGCSLSCFTYKLEFEGNHYTRAYTNKDKSTTWRCIKKNSGCKAYIKTYKDQVIYEKNVHNHVDIEINYIDKC